MNNPFLSLSVGNPLTLNATGHFRAAAHQWQQAELDALALAYASKRPLLVRGEPGCGKSQLARAAAQTLTQSDPLVEVIHPRFEALDLLYRFDAMARMQDAQLGIKGQWDASNKKYIHEGVLWRAIAQARAQQKRPVVLIDEIDKADADVPNSLLDVLANHSFEVPMWSNGTRVSAQEGFAPLIIITTNEERELPAAFVRRCMVLNLNPPSDPKALTDWLTERVRAHAHIRSHVSDPVIAHAVAQTLADRAVAVQHGFPKVGLAEVIDLLSAIVDITADEPQATRDDKQREWLDRLSAYALVKHATEDGLGQRRPGVDPAGAASATDA